MAHSETKMGNNEVGLATVLKFWKRLKTLQENCANVVQYSDFQNVNGFFFNMLYIICFLKSHLSGLTQYLRRSKLHPQQKNNILPKMVVILNATSF